MMIKTRHPLKRERAGKDTFKMMREVRQTDRQMRRFSAGAVNNLQIGGALTRIIYNGVLLSKF